MSGDTFRLPNLVGDLCIAGQKEKHGGIDDRKAGQRVDCTRVRDMYS